MVQVLPQVELDSEIFKLKKSLISTTELLDKIISGNRQKFLRYTSIGFFCLSFVLNLYYMFYRG